MTSSTSTWAIASDRSVLALAVLLAGSGLAQAGEPVPLASVLDRAASQAEQFWNYFPAVTCTELVTQSKLDARGKVVSEKQASYDYLTFLQADGARISVEESRSEKKVQPSKGGAPLLATSGFSTLALIFHPIYQSSYEFQELTAEPGDARLLRVAFRHRFPQDRSPSVLVLHGREYPLEWKGTAWLDRATDSVVRIQAQLEQSMEDIGLVALTADVTYSPVVFAGAPSPYLLPARAVIEADSKHQRWRNVHVFTGYRRFNVETEVRTVLSK